MKRLSKPQPNAWARMKALAENTPATRNRYVDFLRAVSILAVVIGHWLLAAPYLIGNWLMPADLLSHSPWTHWLTWVFQVLPIFFMVGGYANSVSWQTASRRGEGYNIWLAKRFRRLIMPVLPVIILWNIIGVVAYALDAYLPVVNAVARFALLPAWFLIIYLFEIIFVPWTYQAWQKIGFFSIWLLIGLTALVDFLSVGLGWEFIGWANFFFVWLAIHQLGFAWRAGKMQGARKTLLWALGSGILLFFLFRSGAYPISMVPVQGNDLSNVFPPNLLLLAFAFLQMGLFLSPETLVRHWLKKSTLWAMVVLINRGIMSVLMWHVTAMMIVIMAASMLGGIGLKYFPGTLIWWQVRPLWFLAAIFVLMLILPLVLRFEETRPAPKNISLWRLILGIALICIGLSVQATVGIIVENAPGIRLWVFILPLVGAWLGGILPAGKWGRSVRESTSF